MDKFEIITGHSVPSALVSREHRSFPNTWANGPLALFKKLLFTFFSLLMRKKVAYLNMHAHIGT